jgi:hypothetical protein
VTDPSGAAYVFRIIAAEPEHPPASLDEVREQVVKDLKNRMAYEALVARADELAATAREKGLDSLAEAHKSKVEKPQPVSAYDPFALAFAQRISPPQLEGIGMSSDFVKTLFEKIRAAADPAGLIEPIPVADAKKLVVVKVVKFEPIDSERYEAQRPMLAGIVYGSELQSSRAMTSNPLSFEAVRERVGYKSADEDEDEDGSENEQAPAADKAASPKGESDGRDPGAGY